MKQKVQKLVRFTRPLSYVVRAVDSCWGEETQMSRTVCMLYRGSQGYFLELVLMLRWAFSDAATQAPVSSPINSLVYRARVEWSHFFGLPLESCLE